MMYERTDGTLCMYSRLCGGIGLSVSDTGANRSPVRLLLPNFYARFFIYRLKSGRKQFVHGDSLNRREKPTAFLSEDRGMTFNYKPPTDTCDGVSYPDAAETQDGKILLIHLYARVGTGEDIMTGTAPRMRVISKI